MTSLTQRILIDQAGANGRALDRPPCPCCGGDGVSLLIISPEWALWHRDWYAAYVAAFLADMPGPAAYADEVAGEPPDGPEEVPCPACTARGGAPA